MKAVIRTPLPPVSWSAPFGPPRTPKRVFGIDIDKDGILTIVSSTVSKDGVFTIDSEARGTKDFFEALTGEAFDQMCARLLAGENRQTREGK